jgi:Domain of unknown function (DUF4402)
MMTSASVFRLALCGFAALAALAVHEGARAANAVGTVGGVVLGPNSIVKIEDLDFGSLIASPVAGTATIDAQTGARTLAGGVTDAGGAFRRAEFEASGSPNRVISLSISPTPSIAITNDTGQTMTINQIRVSVNGGTPQPLGPNHTIGSNGIISFDIGGRLNIAANQAEGTYSGTFTLTSNYQ